MTVSDEVGQVWKVSVIAYTSEAYFHKWQVFQGQIIFTAWRTKVLRKPMKTLSQQNQPSD
jgi:hypothetical protein